MAITHTNIGGTIPTELGMLTGTKNMNLLDNNLDGPFPRELTNLRAMGKFVRHPDGLLFTKGTWLTFANPCTANLEIIQNYITGTVPIGICQLPLMFLSMDCIGAIVCENNCCPNAWCV